MVPTQIIAMINKYYTSLARFDELTGSNTNEYEVARILGTYKDNLVNYRSARRMYSDKHLTEAFSALLKADLSIKTTSLDDYTLISVLIAEIIPD
jgi:DNA polymerase III delta subunit